MLTVIKYKAVNVNRRAFKGPVLSNSDTASGKKLYLSLLVWERRLLYHLADGRRVKSPWFGWVSSLTMDLALFKQRSWYVL